MSARPFMYIYLSLFIILVSFSTLSSDMNSCFKAGKSNKYNEVLKYCITLAKQNDISANYYMGLAIIKVKTKFTDPNISKIIKSNDTQYYSPKKKSWHEALNFLRVAADNGHSGAQYLIGYLIIETWVSALKTGFQLDDINYRGERWLKKAAKSNNIDAINLLATRSLLLNSQNEIINFRDELINYLKLAAMNGNSKYISLYKKYQNFVIEKDKVFVNPLLYKADIVGIEGIRLLKEYLFANKLNNKKALKLLKNASSRGHALSNYHLGVIYEKGKPEQAFEYFLVAGEARHIESMYWLGRYFGCHKNTAMSKKWLQKAVQDGHSLAIEDLEEVNDYGDLSDCL